MMARRPTTACIRLHDRTTAAYAPARSPTWRATAYPVAAPMAMVASAEGRRIASDVGPSRAANAPASQK